MPTKVIMPKLGESVVEGTVINWLKNEGDPVEEFESILEVESAKVNTEIPSPAAGTLLRILVPAGETVAANTVIAWIGEPGEEIPAEDSKLPPSEQVKPAEQQSQALPAVQTAPHAELEAVPMDDNNQVPAGRDRDLGFISPVVAKIASENKVDLTKVKGTGQGGRISKKDILGYIEKRKTSRVEEEAAAWETPGEGDLFRPAELQFPERFASKAASAETAKPTARNLPQSSLPQAGGHLIPHTNIRRRIAEHMQMSKRTSPHVTSVMEANMLNVSLHRDKNKQLFANQGVHLTFTAYFVAATAQALQKSPMVNSSWTDEGILVKNAINIGIATSLGEEGLIVPVIKNADSYSLIGIARQVNSLGEKARNHALVPDDVVDATFTITNHGTAGSLFATPIINQPQAGILGVGLIQKRAVVIADAIAIRPMVYLSLSFDHRILDGSSADGFLAEVVKILENWN